MSTPQLSVVIPVFNEEQGLQALFDRLYPALDKLGISYEEALIVIHTLRGRGVIGQRNESKWTASSKPPVIPQKPVAVASTPLKLATRHC